MKLSDQYLAYLTRTARKFTKELGRRVTEREVCEAILDVAIGDEGLFDPEDPGQPMSATRREIIQVERQARTADLEPHELLQTVL